MKPPFLVQLALVLALVAMPSPSFAQQPAAAETLQQQNSTQYQTSPTSDTNANGDKDLGEIGTVQQFPVPATLTASISQQVFYNDNVFYSDAAPKGSAAYLGTYTLSYVPYSLRQWTPRVTLQYNMARYDRAAAADFDNENLVISSTYFFTEDHTWSWTAAVDLSRFTAPHLNGHEFYQEVVYDNQISHIQQLTKSAPLYLVEAYDLAYHQTNPGIYDRLENSVALSIAYYPVPEVTISPFVRPAVRNYVTDTTGQKGRNDFNISEGLNVNWNPIEYLTVSGDIIRADNFSNNKGLNYESTIPGLALTGTYKF